MKSIKLVYVLLVMGILMGFFSLSAFARQYNPETGRFTRRDPIQYAETAGRVQVDLYTYATRQQGVQPQPFLSRSPLLTPYDEEFITETAPIGYEDGINPYSYVHNNPVNYTDPTGKIAWAPIAYYASCVCCVYLIAKSAGDRAGEVKNAWKECKKKSTLTEKVKCGGTYLAKFIADTLNPVDTQTIIQDICCIACIGPLLLPAVAPGLITAGAEKCAKYAH